MGRDGGMCGASVLPRDYRSMNSHGSDSRMLRSERKERSFLSLARANKNIPGDQRATRIAVLTITLTVLCTVTATLLPV